MSNWSALTSHQEDVALRAKRLWKDDKHQGERLVNFLTGHNHNVLGEAMLSAMVTSMAPDDLLSLFGNRGSVLVAAVQRDPQLASMPSIWSGSEDLQRELFDAATSERDVSNDELSSIVHSMLAGRVRLAADQLRRRFGDMQVSTVLNWLNGEAPSSDAILPGWRRYIGDGIKAAVSWLREKHAVEPRVLAILCRVFDPRDSEVQELGADLWTSAIGSPSNLRRQELSDLAVFSSGTWPIALIAIGLRLGSTDVPRRTFTGRSRPVRVQPVEDVREAGSIPVCVEKLGQV